jgi:hypothetical protein
MLLLNGDLDPQTPLKWADVAAPHFNYDKQHFVVVPFAPHGTLFQSPVKNSNNTCGLDLILR